jgi:ribonuclease R
MKKYLEEKKSGILEFLKDEASRPMSFKELTRSLDVPKEERDAFKGVLKELVADGSLIKIRGGRYAFPSRLNLIPGTLTCHPDGFGFVVPEEAGEREEGDVFINSRRLSGAMHGDKVVARVERVKDRGRREGRIIRVVQRAHKTVVGRFESTRGFGVVVPSDERVLDRVIIPSSARAGATDGAIVVAEITRWPAKDLGPAGRVTEVIGDPDDPDVEADVILRKYGLPLKFPPEVMAEAAKVPPAVPPSEMEGRVDLRGRPTFTIDGETAKDFDDAVSIEKLANGFKLFVSIADVSHYVHEGSSIDAEAFSRGTSVYFPDRCVPMLPEALSNGICSLNPGVDRLAMTAEIDFDEVGLPGKKRFYNSVIKSAERLTYTNVRKLLGEEEPSLSERYAHIIDDLRAMEALAGKLNAVRVKDGSLDFDLPEPQIIIDIEGRIEDIVRSERNVAHRIIEEFMLAANRAVAEVFVERKLPFIFRVHDSPDAESVADFKEFIAGFGLHMKGKATPAAFQRVLKSVDGRPEEKIINHVLLRSMKQAVYSDGNIGHFGLAFEDYTHFTSPIRRYPDLIVHRLLKLHLAKGYTGKVREHMEEVLPEAASQSSKRERKAMEAEREVVDLKKAQFMRDKVGGEFEGFVSGVTSFGIFVELTEYFVEALVHVSTLADDYYIYDELRHTLTGEHTRRVFRIGDPVTVLISRVDLERRRIDAVLAGGPEQRPVRRRRGRRG